MNNSLTSKVVLITGSSRNIGRALALSFAAEGCTVIVNSRRSSNAASKLLKELRTFNKQATFIAADVSKPNEVSKLFRKIKQQFGKIDILVNNVGGGKIQNFRETTLSDWQTALNQNLFSAAFCSQEAIKIMRSGCIINIASVRGLYHAGHPQMLAYSAAKAALLNFSCTLAKTLAPHIRVNAVAAGFVETKDKMPAKGILANNVQTSDVLEAVLYLAKASAVTGSVVVVDAGFQLR